MAELVESKADEYELASRSERFGASIVDGVIVAVVMAPIAILTVYFSRVFESGRPSLGESFLYGVLSVVVFTLINGKLLLSRGQTIGKKYMEIEIRTMEMGRPDISNYLRRYAVYFIPGQIPIIGGLFSLINILFIFTAQKRCIHDLVGDTKVVKSK